MVAVQVTGYDGGVLVDHGDRLTDAGTARRPSAGRGWTFRRVSVDPGPTTLGAGAPPEDGSAVATRFVVEFDGRFTMVVAVRGAASMTATLLRQALHGGAAGVHVEFSDADGRELVVFRPHGAAHRLLDLDAPLDGDAEPPLSKLGEYAPIGNRLDPDTRDARVDTVAWLAGKDPAELWHAASVVQRARVALASSAEQAGRDPNGELTVGDETGPDAVAPSRRFRLLGRTRSATPHRSIAAQLADAADANWRSIAGDAEVDDALALRTVIEACHHIGARLRALSAVACEGRDAVTVTSRELAEALVDLLPSTGSNAPHVVTLPGAGLVPEVWSLVLDQLVSAAVDDGRQVVVVTDDRAMADWGRLEAHARRATLVELA